MKLKNTTVSSDIVSSDIVKYVGEIPTCALPQDCTIDATQLTYLLGILLQRYCEQNNIVDASLSSVDIACLIANNPDVVVPETITVETLAQYYSNVICQIYPTIQDLQLQVNNINGIICTNDSVAVDQNSSVIVDAVFNDLLIGISGSPVIAITQTPLNGIATINIINNSITYKPNTDFIGNDTITYQVTKGGYTCTGKISLTVNKVITEQTITDVVVAQMVAILESPQYWDVGIPIGTKLGISQENLIDFTIDPTGINTLSGKGKVGTKWEKWAICNGNNGTEDFTRSTFRGYDETYSDYNYSTASGGVDSITLNTDNIPPHRHGYDFIMGDDSGTPFSGYNSAFGGNKAFGTSVAQAIWDGGSDHDFYTAKVNTGNGVDNLNGQNALLESPASLNIRNEYKTLILVQKVETNNTVVCGCV